MRLWRWLMRRRRPPVSWPTPTTERERRQADQDLSRLQARVKRLEAERDLIQRRRNEGANG